MRIKSSNSSRTVTPPCSALFPPSHFGGEGSPADLLASILFSLRRQVSQLLLERSFGRDLKMGLGSRSRVMAVHRRRHSRPLVLHLFLLCLLPLYSSGFRAAEAYKNYTVGGDLGWYDKLEQPKVEYQKWADARNFSLGDFLIFNTDRNHSVVQTYNATTYNSCSYDDSLDTDTQLWSAGPPTADTTAPATIPVPLVREGPNYFFSGDYDGEQCRNGQRFHMNVTHGQGLPASLSTPEPAAPGPAAGDDGSADVPENFDHPKDVQAAKGDDSAAEAAGAGFGQTPLLVAALAILQWGAVGLFG